MNKLINTIKNSKLLIFIVAFVIGGILTMIFLPEKIKKEIQEKEVIKWKTKTVEVVKWKEKEVIKYKEINKKTYKKIVRIKLPDGTFKEEIIEYSSIEEMARLEESIREKYKAELLEKEKEWSEEKKKLVEHTNPKRIKTYAGMNVAKWSEKEYLGGIQYKIWGPINVGIEATTKANVFPVIGIEF